MEKAVLLHLLLHTVLLALGLLYVVPSLTDSGVVVRRSSLLRGMLGVVVIALGNKVLWHVLVALGVMAYPLPGVLGVALVGWLLNACVIWGIGRLMPGVLYVRSFTAALGGALAFMLYGAVVAYFLF